jgi:hypothetical protein
MQILILLGFTTANMLDTNHCVGLVNGTITSRSTNLSCYPVPIVYVDAGPLALVVAGGLQVALYCQSRSGMCLVFYLMNLKTRACIFTCWVFRGLDIQR